GVAELVRLARVLGLLQRSGAAGAPPEVDRLVRERTEARARRDFRRSDDLRAEIQRLGWLVEDTPGGPRLTRKGGGWPKAASTAATRCSRCCGAAAGARTRWRCWRAAAGLSAKSSRWRGAPA